MAKVKFRATSDGRIHVMEEIALTMITAVCGHKSGLLREYAQVIEAQTNCLSCIQLDHTATLQERSWYYARYAQGWAESMARATGEAKGAVHRRRLQFELMELRGMHECDNAKGNLRIAEKCTAILILIGQEQVDEEEIVSRCAELVVSFA